MLNLRISMVLFFIFLIHFEFNVSNTFQKKLDQGSKRVEKLCNVKKHLVEHLTAS